MSWEILIPLIAKYGLPWVIELVGIIKKHPQPTEEAWNELIALTQKPYSQYIEEADSKKG